MNGNDFFGVDFDELRKGIKDFAENMKGFAGEQCGNDYRKEWGFNPCGHEYHDFRFDEAWYPRTNIFVGQDRSLVLEFMLPGFDEKDISLTFKGDKLLLSAHLPADRTEREGCRWERKSFRLRDIERREYTVPADRYDQAAVKAVFRNGILTVTIPALDIAETEGAIKIEIVKEGN